MARSGDSERDTQTGGAADSLLSGGLSRLGHAPPIATRAAVRWTGDNAEPTEEVVIEEVPVALVYNGVPHVVMMASPTDLVDFATGFSITEGLVLSIDDIHGVETVRYSKGIELQVSVSAESMERIEGRNRRMGGRTGCGICGAESFDAVMREISVVSGSHTVLPAAISAAVSSLREGQKLNSETGGVHAAAWALNDGTVTLVREDVGRHNALDKLVGALLSSEVQIDEGFVAITSRASFEMVQKTTVLGASLLAAISAPTALAIKVANVAGLTLVGFVRDGRSTVYTHPERVAIIRNV